MSDVMLIGVLRMPMPDAPDPLTLRQFVDRARQAADRIDADAERIAELEALLERVAPLLEDYAEYANTAPIWHATGGTAEAVNPLVAEVNAAIARSKT